MPGQKTHIKAYKKYSLVITPAVVATIPYWPMPVWIVVGYGLGYLIDPDLDLMGITGAKMRQYKMGLFLWIGWWMIYSSAMQVHGGHRSFVTHFPWISSAIRLAWFVFPLVAIGLYYKWLPNDLTVIPTIGIWIGLGFADLIHYVLDRRG